jgi:hypothetical protein
MGPNPSSLSISIYLTLIVTKVQRAISRIKDPRLSIGSHSAAAFTVVFDHTSHITSISNKYSCQEKSFKQKLLQHKITVEPSS